MEGLEILNEISQEALIVLGIIGAFLALILFILMFYTPYWVYKDANKREMFGMGWGLLVLFFLFFGIIPGLIFLVIYLFIRNPPGGKNKTKEDVFNEPVFGSRRIKEDSEESENDQTEDGKESEDDDWEEIPEDDDIWTSMDEEEI